MQYTSQGACYPSFNECEDESENLYKITFSIIKKGVLKNLPFVEYFFNTKYELQLDFVFDEYYTVIVKDYFTETQIEECRDFFVKKTEACDFKFNRA